MLAEPSTLEHLDIRHAQLDALFAQSDLIKARLRLLHRRPAGVLFKQLHLFYRQCRLAKKVLKNAEEADYNSDLTRNALDQACHRLRHMLAELNHKLPCAAPLARDTIQIQVPAKPGLHAAVLNPQAQDRKSSSVS
ncbi:MAG: hypothetical protein LLF76_08030 [Planctomycetaceae bacterium]|nr:hypothetical protein [Planctomycetaceae bacterium]